MDRTAGGGPPPSISQHFRLVFFGVLGLTVGSLVVSGLIATFVPNPSDEAKAIFNVTLSIFQIGAGAVIGLIGGEALQ
jgi:hypothetical protein